MERHFINQLLGLQGRELRMIYTLLFLDNSYLLKDKKVSLHTYIEKKVSELSKSDVMLQMDIFLEITRIFKLKGLDYQIEENIYQQAKHILQSIYNFAWKDDKSLRSRTDLTKRWDGYLQHYTTVFKRMKPETETITIEFISSNHFLQKHLQLNNVIPSLFSKRIIQKRFLMVLVVPLLQQYEDKRNTAIDSFIQEWQKRFGEYKSLAEQLHEIEIERSGVLHDFEENEAIISEINKQIARTKKQLELEKKTLASLLKFAELEDLDVNSSFDLNKKEYLSIRTKISKLYRMKQALSTKNKLFHKVGSVLTNMSVAIQIQAEEKKANYYLEEMVEDLLSSKIVFKETEQQRITDLEKKLVDLNKWQAQHRKYQEMLQKELAQLRSSVISIRKDMKLLEDVHYGLKDLQLIIETPLLEDTSEE